MPGIIDLGPDTTDYVFHYTIASTFRKITESGTMLATHIQFLNDESEYKYTLDMLRQTVRNWYKDGKAGSPVFSAMSTFIKSHDYHEEYKYGNSLIPMDPGVYVMCFSGELNDLSQWRAYCPNGGYSIGFHKKDIDSIIKHINVDEREHRDIKFANFPKSLRDIWALDCAEFVEADYSGDHTLLQDAIHKLFEIDISDEVELSTAVHAMLKLTAPRIKHPLFIGENEQRIVIRTPYSKDILFSETAICVRPQVPVAMFDNLSHPIHIMAAPSSHREIAVLGAKHMLMHRSAKDKDNGKLWTYYIVPSDAPLRTGL